MIENLNFDAKRKKRLAYINAEPLIFEGAKALLNGTDFVVVRTMDETNGPSVEQALSLHPDIVMVKIKNIEEGEVLVDQLSRFDVNVPFVFLDADEKFCQMFRERGVNYAFLSRAVTSQNFVNAISIVANGGNYIDPNISMRSNEQARLTNADCDGDDDDQIEMSILSEREKTVLHQVALGHYSKEIAANLNLSIKTIETYKNRAMNKLQLTDRASIVRYAVTNGWFDS
ncbi:response regulator transcription factor [Cohaesibacter haloalkalitolerans]|uniref:response regulator transcription factor n=1 Tax=Cohaesibacter haloalkalitolerans TaxID=1162980 RepID=UPI000E65971C|nr:response regulator transcription factor [Cohaesibacter haloalkalitolerans]